MRKPKSVTTLEELGRVRLSKTFFLRDFLYSEISQIYGIPNIPDDPDLAIEVGKLLCEELLEPLQDKFGRIAIRSAYRSCAVNQLGNENGHSCASNESNYAGHIWDRVDAEGNKGAMACIVIPALTDHVDAGGDWRSMAWWIHDHLTYGHLYFYPKLTAFNISWYEGLSSGISSYIEPRGTLTQPGMPNFEGDHSEFYSGIPMFDRPQAGLLS
jgi:hypothetical protein